MRGLMNSDRGFSCDLYNFYLISWGSGPPTNLANPPNKHKLSSFYFIQVYGSSLSNAGRF